MFDALEVAKSAGTLRSADVSYRSRLWQPAVSRDVLADMVEHADTAFATLEEAALVTNATSTDPATAAVSIARPGPQFVVVQLGRDGAVACPGNWEGLPTRSEVDLVGGGDVVR